MNHKPKEAKPQPPPVKIYCTRFGSGCVTRWVSFTASTLTTLLRSMRPMKKTCNLA